MDFITNKIKYIIMAYDFPDENSRPKVNARAQLKTLQ